MIKVIINEEFENETSMIDGLNYIIGLIEQGNTSGYYPTWNIIDISEKQEKIEFIKKVLSTWGTTSTAELKLESSPIYNNLTGKICTLVQGFTEDYVHVVTYDDDIDIDEEDVPYEKLSDELIDEIHTIMENYDAEQEKLYDSIRDEDF
jgi:hypothetical protein